MKIVDHRLTEADWKPVPHKTSGVFRKGDPRFVVMHYTATTTLESAVKTLSGPRPASAHVVVDRDGTIVQLGGFHQVMWHAGRSSWRGWVGLNRRSIGIEIVNPGWLVSGVDGEFRTWDDQPVAKAFAGRGRARPSGPEQWWHSYAPDQLDAVRALVLALADTYPTLQEVVGHDEIAPRRKVDPGPLFPLDLFKTLLEPRSDRSFPLMRVLATRLNVRVGPGRSEPLARRPLPRGTRVRVLEEEGAWSKVAAGADDAPLGWVASRYLGA